MLKILQFIMLEFFPYITAIRYSLEKPGMLTASFYVSFLSRIVLDFTLFDCTNDLFDAQTDITWHTCLVIHVFMIFENNGKITRCYRDKF
jgi:hypothetical protein